MKKYSCSRSGLIRGFRVVCAIVEAKGDIIARDLKRLNRGLLAAAKQGAGRPHCRERIVALHFK
jgi:hypothetical protein